MINLKLSIMVFTIDMLKISHPQSVSAPSTGRSMRHVEVDGHRLTDFDVKVYQACYQIPIGKGRRTPYSLYFMWISSHHLLVLSSHHYLKMVLHHHTHTSVSTYKSVAEQIGSPRAFRAVGSSLRKNPFAPTVPCHRVVASDLSLGQSMPCSYTF